MSRYSKDIDKKIIEKLVKYHGIADKPTSDVWKRIALELSSDPDHLNCDYRWQDLRNYFQSSLVLRLSRQLLNDESLIDKLQFPYLAKIYSLKICFISRQQILHKKHNAEENLLLIKYCIDGTFDPQIVKVFKRLRQSGTRVVVNINVEDPVYGLSEDCKKLLLQLNPPDVRQRKNIRKTKPGTWLNVGGPTSPLAKESSPLLLDGMAVQINNNSQENQTCSPRTLLDKDSFAISSQEYNRIIKESLENEVPPPSLPKRISDPVLAQDRSQTDLEIYKIDEIYLNQNEIINESASWNVSADPLQISLTNTGAERLSFSAPYAESNSNSKLVSESTENQTLSRSMLQTITLASQPPTLLMAVDKSPQDRNSSRQINELCGKSVGNITCHGGEFETLPGTPTASKSTQTPIYTTQSLVIASCASGNERQSANSSDISNKSNRQVETISTQLVVSNETTNLKESSNSGTDPLWEIFSDSEDSVTELKESSQDDNDSSTAPLSEITGNVELNEAQLSQALPTLEAPSNAVTINNIKENAPFQNNDQPTIPESSSQTKTSGRIIVTSIVELPRLILGSNLATVSNRTNVSQENLPFIQPNVLNKSGPNFTSITETSAIAPSYSGGNRCRCRCSITPLLTPQSSLSSPGQVITGHQANPANSTSDVKTVTDTSYLWDIFTDSDDSVTEVELSGRDDNNSSAAPLPEITGNVKLNEARNLQPNMKLPSTSRVIASGLQASPNAVISDNNKENATLDNNDRPLIPMSPSQKKTTSRKSPVPVSSIVEPPRLILGPNSATAVNNGNNISQEPVSKISNNSKQNFVPNPETLVSSSKDSGVSKRSTPTLLAPKASVSSPSQPIITGHQTNPANSTSDVKTVIDTSYLWDIFTDSDDSVIEIQDKSSTKRSEITDNELKEPRSFNTITGTSEAQSNATVVTNHQSNPSVVHEVNNSTTTCNRHLNWDIFSSNDELDASVKIKNSIPNIISGDKNEAKLSEQGESIKIEDTSSTVPLSDSIYRVERDIFSGDENSVNKVRDKNSSSAGCSQITDNVELARNCHVESSPIFQTIAGTSKPSSNAAVVAVHQSNPSLVHEVNSPAATYNLHSIWDNFFSDEELDASVKIGNSTTETSVSRRLFQQDVIYVISDDENKVETRSRQGDSVKTEDSSRTVPLSDSIYRVEPQPANTVSKRKHRDVLYPYSSETDTDAPQPSLPKRRRKKRVRT
ncbi:dentin sialophosphoprotein-like isoform X2 [Wyeomyia smithii]|uniref:dentin sialophosphoprotein-like isoform X2 n=1 Tax=Wyeomyia smithii TaxID=174621 RepID=UPI002467FA45|nr:dentin sialophosphoprotein-like isoform X2 [Wyeomyia smithii]